METEQLADCVCLSRRASCRSSDARRFRPKQGARHRDSTSRQCPAPLYSSNSRCFLMTILRCIGYLGHPFVKEALWAFTARLFFVVKGILAIEIAGKSFSWTKENGPVLGSRLSREACADRMRELQKAS
jgi:hypothetical protein